MRRAVYVEHGAADAGIAGLDQILRARVRRVPAVELPYGHCRMMLDRRPDAPQLSDGGRIATKYPRIARQYLDSRALRGELVPLGGSVELAAVLGLTSHVIDLVETGENVRVHKLVLQRRRRDHAAADRGEELLPDFQPEIARAHRAHRESKNAIAPNPLA